MALSVYRVDTDMLPSKYILNNNESSSRNRMGMPSSSSRPPPPLGITGVVCTSQLIELPNGRGKIHCTIYRPRMMGRSTMSETGTTSAVPRKNGNPQPVRPVLPQPNPPLICVAGGPGMPCQYLTSLVHLIPDRAVVLYDHIGCGQSTSATIVHSNSDSDDTFRSSSFLDDTANDLAVLIETIVPVHSSFHLFGHSMGGIVAYEYIKQRMRTNGDDRRCRTLILASSPTSIAESYQSKSQLIQEIILEIQQSGKSERGSMKRKYVDDDDSSSHESMDDEEQQLQRMAHLEFLHRHECRVNPMPLPLQQSLTGLHRSSTSKNGRNARYSSLDSYVATPILEEDLKDTDASIRLGTITPALLVVRGQYDFVSDSNCRAWLGLYSSSHSSQYITLSNCSHYGFLEQEEMFGSTIMSFLRDHDAENNF